MVEINWGIFASKFDGREAKAFELLAYVLFCHEHKRPLGLFRFKNQTGVETEPIEFDGSIVGFQAKYHSGRLSHHKEDILSSLQRAKSKNPQLTKVLLYTNQELSESTNKRKKKSAFQEGIEQAGAALGLLIEWRVPSHFEIQLSNEGLSPWASHFFSLGRTQIDSLAEIRRHSDNILFPIRNYIGFKGSRIYLDRSELLRQIEAAESDLIIVRGEGGSGKTALVRELYDRAEYPVYIFKAAEFNVTHIADFFGRYGDITLDDFLKAHVQEEQKAVVIDSAEKLADLENQDTFKEFLAAVLQSEWKVIFTTRDAYFEDICFQLDEIYRRNFSVVRTERIPRVELQALSAAYGFPLPGDDKLLSLIQTPFYLEEYLDSLEDIDRGTNLAKFKEIIWSKKIQNSAVRRDNIHLDREECFMRLAVERCETGRFFVRGNNCAKRSLSLLENDEIIRYDNGQRGYFITHDIYEEWALDRVIETHFNESASYGQFFTSIGTSLAIRRAFRIWLSNKLSLDIQSVRIFIETAFRSPDIQGFWKDEVIVSVMLSEYSQAFFETFGDMLMENDKYYLKRMLFLLQIGCKEIDAQAHESFLRSSSGTLDKSWIFTKPKGMGWPWTIAFLYDNIGAFSYEDLPFILPILREWGANTKRGEVLRISSLFALHFYKLGSTASDYGMDKETEQELVRIILAGALEIKEELRELIEELTSDKNPPSPYDELTDALLTLDGSNLQVILAIPEELTALLEKAWYCETSDEERRWAYGGMDAEASFSIPPGMRQEYFPASAYQTPIYWMLQCNFQDTALFVLKFVNKSVSYFATSGFDDNVREIEVKVGERRIRQFISPSLWNAYRGTGSPGVPYLFQSVHMALEKRLLEMAKSGDRDVVKKWLIYLLENSTSASISAVVCSVVSAYPENFFEVAAILFRNYEFLRHDNWRASSEGQAKGLYGIMAGLNYEHKRYEEERLATCEQGFRRKCLEHIALEYQFFRQDPISEEESESRIKEIHRIIDEHLYALEGVPDSRTARLLLARMDRRGMNPIVEKGENGMTINFNPQMDADLKSYSEEQLRTLNDKMRYMELTQWCQSRFEGRPSKSIRYDDNPELIVQHIREIIESFDDGTEEFILYYRSTPAFGACVLLSEYEERLSAEDLQLCREIVVDYASWPFSGDYMYQLSDGVEAAIRALSILYKLFPEDRKDYNIMMLFILLDQHPLGHTQKVCDYAISSIQRHLYSTSPGSASAILLGYLKLKEDFDAFILKRSNELFAQGVRPDRRQLLQDFCEKNEHDVVKIANESLEYSEVNVEGCQTETLVTAFRLIPAITKDNTHLGIVKRILPVLSEILLSDYDENHKRTDLNLSLSFFQTYAYFLLQRDPEEIPGLLRPVLDNLAPTDQTARLISAFVSAEDNLGGYENFWIVWNAFFPEIKALSTSQSSSMNELLENYLLAWQYWKPTAKQWRSLKEREKRFFARSCQELGHSYAALYSISRFLNEIGSDFLNEGVIWISEMLSTREYTESRRHGRLAVYYLEKIVRKYVYGNRTKLKREKIMKDKLLTILQFLVSKGSVNAYLLREEIL